MSRLPIALLFLALTLLPKPLADPPPKPEPIPIIETVATTGAAEAKPEPVRTEVFEITAYTWTGYHTASGVWPEYGMCAADWDVLPPGTIVDIPDYGIAVVTDRGGDIYGNRLDIYLNSEYECIQFGRQWLEVQILEVPNGTD